MAKKKYYQEQSVKVTDKSAYPKLDWGSGMKTDKINYSMKTEKINYNFNV